MKNNLFYHSFLWIAAVCIMMSSPLKAIPWSSSESLVKTGSSTNLSLQLEEGVFVGNFGLNASFAGADLTYCNVNFLAFGSEPISRVVFAGIDHPSSASTVGAVGYEDFTSIKTDVVLGESYSISLEGNTGGDFTSYFNVFIDWNQNGIFDSDEEYQIGTLKNSTGEDGMAVLGNIEVPSNAELGETRMRVIKKGSKYGVACSNIDGFGQGEDYTLDVTEAIVETQTTCFEEGFDGLTGHSNDSNGSNAVWNGNDNFPTVEKAYQAGNAVKLGTGNLIGSIESKVLDDVSGDITVKIMVKGWTNIEGNLIIAIDGQSETVMYTARMADAFEEVTATFTGVASGSKLKISTSAKRAFIDHVEIICEEEGGDVPEPVDPCEDKVVMECGVEYTAELLSNAGAWIDYTGVDYAYTGSEQVFEFTAPETGIYTFLIYEGEDDADFILMDDCSNTAISLGFWDGYDWDTEAAESVEIELTEGVTYYLIADLYEVAEQTIVSVQVNCPDEDADPSGYCNVTADTIEEITQVDFAGSSITNSNSSEALIDKTDVVVDVGLNGTYTLTVAGNTYGNFDTNIVAFIDWNQNEILDDEGEVFVIGTLSNSTGTDGVSVSSEITVPEDAVLGETRIRITKTYFDDESEPVLNPCAIEFDLVDWGMGIWEGFGQALDFTLNIGEQVDSACEATDVPYYQDFETAIVPGLPECTSVENVGAGNEWTTASGESYGFSGTYLRYRWNNDYDGDTWFYTQGINLIAGETYKVSYDYGSTGEYFTERLKIAYGVENSSTAMTNILADHPSVTNSTPLTNEVEFTVSTTGVYYIGFNAYSEKNKFYLHVDNIAVELVDGGTTPEPLDTCFEEDFDGLAGGNTTGSGTNGPLTTEWGGNANFPTTVKAYEAGDAVKLGTGSLIGSIESKVLDDISGDITVKLMVKGWTNIEGDLIVEIDGQTQTISYTARMEDAFEEVSVSFSDVAAGSKLKISTSAKRAFIDHVEILCEDDSIEPEPEYCLPSLDCSDGDVILNVTFEEINNSTSCSAGGFGDYTSMVANVEAGNAYPISVTVGDGWYERVSVWIDFDNNGFTEDDFIGEIGDGGTGGVTVTGEINIPEGTALGNYRMRVLGFAAGSQEPASTDPCMTTGFGEYEDYTIAVGEEGTDPGPGDYCEPEFFFGVEPITRVVFAGIDNSSTVNSTAGYEDFTNIFGHVEVGANEEIALEGFTDGNYLNRFTVWVDWNQDGIFSDTEMYEIGSIVNSTGTDGQQAIGTISVPEDAVIGTTRMRVIKEFEQSPSDPCGTYFYGQAEDYSIVVEEAAIEPGDYCEPEFFFDVEPITRVVFAGIDNSSPVNSTAGYEDFTNIFGNVEAGATEEIVLEGFTNGDFENFFTVWIDWNQDGIFSSTEMYEIGSIVNSTGTDGQQAIGTISVPTDAVIGTTRMRVIKEFFQSPTDPCGTYFFGQAEDYTINVKQLGLNDLSSFDFAYYPNPVKDVLNITSQVGVKSVEVFNLVGQKVLTTLNVNEGRVDVTTLSVGTYVFRATLESGQVKTFKIIKK